MSNSLVRTKVIVDAYERNAMTLVEKSIRDIRTWTGDAAAGAPARCRLPEKEAGVARRLGQVSETR